MKQFLITLALVLAPLVCIAQWQQTPGIPPGGGVTDIEVTENGIIIVTTASFNYPNGQMGGVRYSTTNGASWHSPLNYFNGRTIETGPGGYVYISAWDYPISFESLYRSTNNGVTYSPLYSVGSGNNIFAIESANNNQTIYIGTRTGIRASGNGGFNFITMGNGIPNDAWVFDIEYDSASNTLAAGTSKGLYLTTNGGTSWFMPSGMSTNDTIYTLSFRPTNTDGQDDNVIAATSDGDVYDVDIQAQLGVLVFTFFSVEVSDMKFIDDTGLAVIGFALCRPFGADNSSVPGLYYTTNGGSSWTEYNGGLPGNPVMSAMTYKMQGSTLQIYAGVFDNTNNGARIFTAASPVGIIPISSEVPDGYSLSQNYPNPFNPETKIKFSVPKTGFVSISVYDAIGRKVSELVNQNLQPGTYEADWNAAGLTSGTYFYRINADGYNETKKMTLIK